MCFRQYIYSTLRDRLGQVPKIENIQKKWIVFQLIHAVKQLQNLSEFHGNITPENIMVTSSDWVFLTDWMFYKKTFLGENDHQINSSYFGDFINQKRWYIAPERFIKDKTEAPKVKNKEKFSMDVFSLGWVIAEIFRNGRPLFDLPKLMEYKRGELIIDESYFEQEIQEDKFITKIILSMINLDPSKRKTIDQYLNLFLMESMDSQSDSFPRSFHEMLYPLGKAFLQPDFLMADEKIALMYEKTSKSIIFNFRRMGTQQFKSTSSRFKSDNIPEVTEKYYILYWKSSKEREV
jgi:phosphoinositide-3-kinase regulatory subunit 4